MKTHTQIRRLILLLALVMPLSVGDSAQAQSDDTDEASAPVNTLDKAIVTRRIKQESVDAAAKVGGAPVIVKVRLRRPFRPVGNLTAGELDQQEADIRTAQAAVLKAVAGTKFSEVKRFRFIPWMALTGETATLRALVSSKDVLRVRIDHVLKPGLDVSVPLIGGDRVHATGSTGAGQTVAILDTGVDRTHPFLAGRIVSEACFSTSNPFIPMRNVCPSGNDSTASGSGVPCAVSACFHGTAVAGIAAGRANVAAGMPFSGVAPDATIIAIQVFSAKSSSSPLNPCSPEPAPCARSLTSDVIEGLEHVLTLRNRFRIAAVNLSLGDEWYTSQADCDDDHGDYKDAIDNLRSVRIATVAASGNEAVVNRNFVPGIARPACISSAISVGSTTKPFVVGGPEQVTPSSQTATLLTILAPGRSITTSVPTGFVASGKSSFGGTSMAAPHVTGAIAVLQGLQPGQSVTDIINTLTRTGPGVFDARLGAAKPRVQLDAAVEAQTQTPLRPSNLRVTTVTGRTITLGWNDNSRSEVRFEVTATPVGNPRRLPSSSNPHPGANTTVTTIDGLTPNSEYELRVKACNAAGRCSADAGPFVQRTNDTVPRPPTGLWIQTVSNSGFTIAWNLDPSRPVTRYRLRRSLTATNRDPTWTPERDIIPPQVSFLMDNLTGNWGFEWRLQACNADGCSTDAIGPTVRPITRGSPPAAPTNLSICRSSLEERRVCPRGTLLEWSDNSNDEDRYELEWFQAGPRIPNWNRVPLETNRVSFLMSELTRGGLYSFRVRACNVFGCSRYSNTVTFTVP